MQDQDRQTLRRLLDEGRKWEESSYVAQRDRNRPLKKRTIYRYLGHTVTLSDEEMGKTYEVRHLYVHSSALAAHEATRCKNKMAAIESDARGIDLRWIPPHRPGDVSGGLTNAALTSP